MKKATKENKLSQVGQLSDKDILELIRRDHSTERGFNFLVVKYQKKVYWHVRRMLIDHDDTNDVVQETFIKIWRNLGQFRGESELFTWIYRIATNETLGFLKKQKKRYFLPVTDASNHLANSLENDAFFTGDSYQLKFQQALLKLPDRQRLVFNMKYFEDMKYEEIAQITGVTVGALKASYHHAVKKIKNSLKHN